MSPITAHVHIHMFDNVATMHHIDPCRLIGETTACMKQSGWNYTLECCSPVPMQVPG